LITYQCNESMDKATIEAINKAVTDLRDGKLIIYPTETVYGIGADAFDEAAAKKVYIAKSRPFDMPLSVAVSDLDMMRSIAEVTPTAEKLAEAFLPGPLTIIIKKRSNVPDIVTSMSDKVGIRITDHPIARELARRFGPIITTSANKHSKPDAVTAQEAAKDLSPYAETCLDSGPCSLGKPSTIVWMKDDEMEIVRQGAITRKQIEEALDVKL
jgi:L-threonylcarbamoyladenylate synthase